MKRQALKAVTMLVSIVALAFMTAVAAGAQPGVQKLKADIPFDFVVGDKTLSAGEYVVGKITTQDDAAMLVRKADGSANAIRLTNTLQANAPTKRAKLIFHRYGNRYFLAQVWTPGSSEGRELLKVKSQRAAEQELAKNRSTGELARNFEVVTIFATVQ